MTESSAPPATTRLAFLLATWFGCGYSPIGPGTAGSLGALAIAWPLVTYAHWPPWMLGLLALLLFSPGVWAGGVVARVSQRKDPGLVVIDEVVGQWLTLAGAASLHSGWTWALGFGLFRLFDIWKPAPARQLEALPGGLGIMADDVMAGLYGALVLGAVGWSRLI